MRNARTRCSRPCGSVTPWTPAVAWLTGGVVDQSLAQAKGARAEVWKIAGMAVALPLSVGACRRDAPRQASLRALSARASAPPPAGRAFASFPSADAIPAEGSLPLPSLPIPASRQREARRPLRRRRDAQFQCTRWHWAPSTMAFHARARNRPEFSNRI